MSCSKLLKIWNIANTDLVSNMLWLERNTISWIVKTKLLDNIACLKENEHDVV